MSDDFDPRSVGGSQLAMSPGEASEKWDFGWVPWDRRTHEERATHDAAIAAMVPFSISGRNKTIEDATKAVLWDCWSDPRVVGSVGFVYSGTHQITGSCVGAGGGNAIFALSAIEVVRLGDPEQALVPFWLLPYGRSRYHCGMRGRGSGSLGSAFAKAMLEDGVVPATLPGLPPFRNDDGLVWGESVELEWSDGARIDAAWLEKSRKHLVRSAALIRSADQGREAIKNGFPWGFCGDWGGLMKAEVKGTPPVLLNRRSGTWNHQQSVHGWWDHPELGELFYVINQWGLRTHGTDPAGGPPGGYWIKKADADYQCRNGECIVYSQFNGFPAPNYPVPWIWK